MAEKQRHIEEGQGVLTLSVAAPYVTRIAAELTYDYKDRYGCLTAHLVLKHFWVMPD